MTLASTLLLTHSPRQAYTTMFKCKKASRFVPCKKMRK